MKAIIEKGKADNNDLADKFTKSLNIPCISYVKAANKVLVYYIFD